jgi:hypothetical protein
MDRNHLIGGILLVLIVVFGTGAALYAGVGPAPGGDSGDDIEEFPTEEKTSSDGSTATSSADTPPFSFTIDNTEECGQTCREVTATLDNNQNETATNVTVYTRIFAGENNTDTDDVVWEDTEDVGTLEAGTSHTTTKQVELSFQEARKVDQKDGWITILTTVESDDTTVTFQNSEQVT